MEICFLETECVTSVNDKNYHTSTYQWKSLIMPKKIRELIQALERVGFLNRGGKGSHRNFKHPQGIQIVISGKPGHDSKRYQEHQVSVAIKKVRK